MGAPEVTVVVPTHDRAAGIPALVAALASQTLAPERFEVVFVDDCSTDGTRDVLARLVRSFPAPVRLLHTPVNTGGPAAPRNIGWRAAEAPVIAFLDDDCLPAPPWLEEGLAVMQADEAVGVVQGRVEVPAGTDVKRLDRWCVWREVTAPSPWFECANIFYRRAALEHCGGFDESLVTWGEDTDLGWRVVRSGWGRGFAPGAAVVHAVEYRGWRNAARFGWRDAQLVALAARYPEIRETGFWCRWAIQRQGAEFAAALLGAGLALRWRPAMVLALPYMYFRRPPLRQPGTVRIGLQTVAVDLVRLAGRLRGCAAARIFVV